MILLILGAVGAILFLCAAALIAYLTSKHLLAARDWEEHSHEVLSVLQGNAQRLDRVELLSRLYFATKDESNLHGAQAAAGLLEAGTGHLEDLVADNPAQTARARELHRCTEDLKKLVEDLPADPSEAQSKAEEDQLLSCRDSMVRMQADENTLLRQRRDDFQRGAYRSLSAGAVLLLVSLVVVLMLFLLLIRDALQRLRYEAEISETNARLSATIRLMEQSAREAGLLASAREELQLCTNLTQAYQVAVRWCSQLLPSARIALLMINNSRQMVEVAATSGETGHILEGFPPNACCGLRSGQDRWRRHAHSQIECEHFAGPPPKSYLCMPLAAHGDTLGVLYVEPVSEDYEGLMESRMEALKSIAKVSALYFASLALRARLEHQSVRDGLTNLFNRHFMEISLDREIRRAARSRTELAVLMIDVDHFKHFNDTYGHDAGDYVLRETAEIFRNSVRAEDIICRYGGEEFVIILPETGAEAARERAEQIRRRVQNQQLRFRGENLRETTVSIGIAIYPENGTSLVDLLRNADRALYTAKHRGRNCVIASLATVSV
ncbi:MAG: sensor domain-containing diguanylate cyclase [Bacillota bacterium]|nr:sensor domain-containing diguanylate cyclase [Bacillota bacterium]